MRHHFFREASRFRLFPVLCGLFGASLIGLLVASPASISRAVQPSPVVAIPDVKAEARWVELASATQADTSPAPEIVQLPVGPPKPFEEITASQDAKGEPTVPQPQSLNLPELPPLPSVPDVDIKDDPIYKELLRSITGQNSGNDQSTQKSFAKSTQDIAEEEWLAAESMLNTARRLKKLEAVYRNQQQVQLADILASTILQLRSAARQILQADRQEQADRQ